MATTATNEIVVRLLSPDDSFTRQMKAYLKDHSIPVKFGYKLYILDPSDTTSDAHIALVDEAYIAANPTERLGALKLQLGGTPTIYLCDQLNTAEELSAVKGLTDDYILKHNLNASSLHNCIRWVLQHENLKLEIEQQNRRYESLFHHAIDPSFVLSPDGILQQANTAFLKLFNLSAESIDEHGIADFFHDVRDWERVLEMLRSDADSMVDCEVQMLRKEAKGRMLCHLKIAVLEEYIFEGARGQKVVAGYHGSLSNISYRERLRNVKKRADRVDMTYRLARTLAHEIRNPLTNINLALEYVRESTDINERSLELLQLIGRSSERINELIDQLLTSSERSHLSIDPCNLVNLINEVLEEAADRAKLVNATLVTDFEATDFEYACDAPKIKLAISNLLCNAIESLEAPGGTVTVGTYNDDGYLHIYVEDNGVGMSDEVKESLFDPFFTSKEKGLGLGLTATQTIISEHNGEIEVESSLGYGSTFTISLPLYNS